MKVFRRRLLEAAIVLGALSISVSSYAAYDSDLAWKGNNSVSYPYHQALTQVPDKLPLGSYTFLDSSDTRSLGNSRFGAGFDASVLGKTVTEDDSFQARLSAELDTWAKIFGNRISVVRFNASARGVMTDRGNNSSSYGKLNMALYLLDQKVWSDSREKSGSLVALDYELKDEQNVGPPFEQRFLVAFVPVRVRAGVNAEEKLTFTGKLGYRGVEGTLQPSARLYAYADGFAGVDYLLGAGVRGELALLSIAAPATAALKWGFTEGESREWAASDGSGGSTQCTDLKVNLGFDWRLKVGTLSGKFDVYAEFFFSTPSVTIADWDGVSATGLLAQTTPFSLKKQWECTTETHGAPVRGVPLTVTRPAVDLNDLDFSNLF